MSAALKQKMTNTIMPEVTAPTPEKLPLNNPQPRPIATSQGTAPSPSAKAAGESPLLGLILVFPFVFLALIVALLAERLIKWGIRKFFAPQTSSQPMMTNTAAVPWGSL